MVHHIGADRVVLVHGERDFQFRSHAVDAGDEDRVAHSGELYSKQASEAADFAEHSSRGRGMRLPNERLDPALELVAKIDINPGARVSLFSCHVERSRDISYYFRNNDRLNSFVSRLSRRFPRGATVHVARPTRSIPRLRSE